MNRCSRLLIAACLLRTVAFLTAQPVQPHLADQFLWLRADLGVTTTEGRVTAWTDQSPRGTVFTPSGVGPVAVAQSPDAGDQPVLRFAGSEQLNGSVPGNTLTEATVFAVFNYTQPSNNDYLYAFGNSGSSGSQFTLSRDDGNIAYHYDGSRQNQFGTIPGSRFLISIQEYGGENPRVQKWTLDSRIIQSTVATGDYGSTREPCASGIGPAGATALSVTSRS